MPSPNGFFKEKSDNQNQLQNSSNFGDTTLDNHKPEVKPNWFKKHPILAISGGLLVTGIIVGLITAIVLNGGLFEFSKKIADNIKQTVVDSSIKAYAEEFSIEPETKDSLGVSSDSKFILKSKQPLTKGQVTANLTAIPATEFEVVEKNTKEFEIKTKNPLPIGTIQKFELKVENDATSSSTQNLSWAFAIKNEFKITSVLPRNKATNVPINYGIEIEFSGNQFQSLDNFFTIKPAVAGQFKKYNNRSVFVPAKLEPATVYTVTIKKDLKLEGSNETLKEDFSFQFETADTPENTRSTNIFERSFFEFTPNQKPTVTVLATKNQTLDTILYRFNDLGQFLDYLNQRQARPRWAIFGARNETYDLAKLQKVLEAKLPVQETNYVNYIDYPSNLEKGYYLAVLPNQDSSIIQITDNSSYLSSSKTKTVVWANNLATKKSINIAQIKDLQNNQIAVTGDDGVAFFDTPEFAKNLDKENYYQLVTPEFTSILPIVNSTRNSPIEGFILPNSGNDNYWHYLSLDRSLYKPSDTVNFWGLVKPRKSQDLLELKAELITYSDLINFNNEPVTIATKNVKLSTIGTILDNFSFKELKTGSYEIRLVDPKTNQLITSKNFSITEFTKPVYTINLKPEKEPYLKNQPVTFKGKVEFNDQVPVQNLVLTYSGDSSGEVTTNQNGEFVITYVPKNSNPESYQIAQSTYINVRPKFSEEAEIEATSFAGFFPYSTVIKNEVKIENGKGVANLNYSQLDASKYVDSTSLYMIDFAGKPIENIPIKATIINYVYDKVLDGQNYNPITKETEDIYRYVRRDLGTTTQDLVTNSQGNSQLIFDITPETEYQLFFDSKDTNGQNIRFSSYLSGIANSPTNYDYYTLNQKATSNSKTGYSVGEPVNLEIFKNNSIDKTSGSDKYLLIKSQNGILDYTLDTKPVLNFNFEDKYVPNVNLNGVKFDGSNYNNIENFGKSIQFNSGDNKTNLEIKTDKESYGPGEKVKLTAFTKDKDGKPKPSKVNLIVTDEALRYIDPIEFNTQDLYNQVGTGINQIYTSHSALRLAADSFGGLGNGGGGGRNNFLDTAFFSEIETNQQGEASTEFTLPDNITSWRITAQSFSSDLFFGLAVKKVIATKPIVVDTILNSSYIENDQPTISLRASGLNLDPKKETTFTLEIPELKYNETKKGPTNGVEFVLDPLKIGNYTLNIKANLDDLSDSIQRKIVVKSGYQNYTTNKSIEIKNPLALGDDLPAGQSIVATFGSRVLTQNYTELQNLSNQNGDRLDQKVSSNKALGLLNKHFKQETNSGLVDYATYQNLDTGGLQLLPYSDTDLRLTTISLLVDNQQLNNPKITEYYSKLSNSENLNLNQLSLILLGQSLLNKPVLNEVQLLLGKPDLDLETKINLALASHQLGDTELARKIFTDNVVSSLKSDPNGNFVPGKNDEETRQLTAIASVLAIKLGFKEAYQMHKFVASSPLTTNLFVLEQVAFLDQFLTQNKSEKPTFSYTLDNQTKEINLEAGQIHQILATKEQIQNLNIISNNPDLYLDLGYNSSITQTKPTTNLTLTRGYSVNGQVTNKFASADIVTVTLKVEIDQTATLDGCYLIKDYLPSGLKPITRSFISIQKTGVEINYPYQTQGQEVSFCYSPDIFKNNTITYLARVLQKGSFTADFSIIQASNNPNIFNTSPKQAVIVG